MATMAMPASCSPAIKALPAERPKTEINMFTPRLFMIQSADEGIWPKEGRLDRNHPSTRPENNAPTLTPKAIGMPLIFIDRAPTMQPTAMPRPTNTISVTLVSRSAYPILSEAAATSQGQPTRVMTSPPRSCMLFFTGIERPLRFNAATATRSIYSCERN